MYSFYSSNLVVLFRMDQSIWICSSKVRFFFDWYALSNDSHVVCITAQTTHTLCSHACTTPHYSRCKANESKQYNQKLCSILDIISFRFSFLISNMELKMFITIFYMCVTYALELKENKHLTVGFLITHLPFFLLSSTFYFASIENVLNHSHRFHDPTIDRTNDSITFYLFSLSHCCRTKETTCRNLMDSSHEIGRGQSKTMCVFMCVFGVQLFIRWSFNTWDGFHSNCHWIE